MKNLGFCAIDSKAVMTELKTARFMYDTQFTSLKNTNQPILSSFKKKKPTQVAPLYIDTLGSYMLSSFLKKKKFHVLVICNC